MPRPWKASFVTTLLFALLVGVGGRASSPAQLAADALPDEPSPAIPDAPEIPVGVDNVPRRREGATAVEDSEPKALPVRWEGDLLIPRPPDPPPDQEIAFADLEKGYQTYYRSDDMEFAGGCLAIRSPEVWQQFWSVHKSGVWPEPPAPGVDFSEDIVLACLLGYWRDCCTAHVEIGGVRSEGGSYRVSVHRHEVHGMLFAITNPYHLVIAPRTGGQVEFVDDCSGQRIPNLPPVP